MPVELMEYQQKAANQLESGKILWGGVGRGKSVVVLDYYAKHEAPKDIYVIATSKKRDSLDWEFEAARFGIGTSPGTGRYGVLHVDSWNNISKYVNIENAFFVFDEQRAVGSGTWAKSFIKIARKNTWVLLSATPGDRWEDYAPVFIANNFYLNMTDFKRRHILYEPFVKYPKVKAYINETKLMLLRNHVLVEMPNLELESRRCITEMWCDYDRDLARRVMKDRWHIYEERPLKDVGEMFRVLRRLCYTDPSRIQMVWDILKMHDRVVIFYNFNYEVELLRTLADGIEVAEYSGHKKDPLPTSDRWVYLVQYVAGAEAWNCTTTDAMILYSLTYSYKNFEQAQGRIDRLNNPAVSLFYYLLVSDCIVDKAVRESLADKKDFNEKRYLREHSEIRLV